MQLLPEKWANTKKLANQAKQYIAPFLTNEVANIRRKAASFESEQHDFRESFRHEAPFKYECTTPYDEIDTVGIIIFKMINH